jgi:hypothetical protein
MVIREKYRPSASWLAAFLLIWLCITGCAGISPYQPRNHREEGPERGIFTGSKGEFVIPLPAEEPQKNEDSVKKSPEETQKSE